MTNWITTCSPVELAGRPTPAVLLFSAGVNFKTWVGALLRCAEGFTGLSLDNSPMSLFKK